MTKKELTKTIDMLNRIRQSLPAIKEFMLFISKVRIPNAG